MKRTSLLILFGLFASLGSVAYGQTTFASISGTVTDPAGAVVPGATVEATHVATGYKYTATTNEVGYYTLSQLREGTYTVRVTAPGFREFLARDVQLVARDQRRLDVRLEVGTVEVTVEVSAGATLIEAETARIGDSKDARQLLSLPLNTRSLYSFLIISPAVVKASGQAARRFAGSRINQSDQSIDGITVSNGYDGTQISPLVDYIESYAEVRVDMANNSADIGAIGQVTVISKSGSNELHGSLFDYYVTPWFRARNPFAPQRATGVRHWPGGSIGGPVWLPKLYDGHNRTFFFFSFETSRSSTSHQLLNPTVPTVPWRSGDFSRELPGTVVRDPFTRQPLPGNRIPASQLNPVALKIQERFYPLPNVGDPNVFKANNYVEQKIAPFNPSTYWTARIDHRFTDRSFLFVRYTWDRSHSRAWEANLPTVGIRWQTRNVRAVNASYTHNIRPNLISETRWGYAFNNNPRNGPVRGLELVRELGLVGLAPNLPDINGIFDVSFSGLGLTRITQTQWRHPGFRNFAQQFQQHLNWYRGRHSIKSGFILDRVNFQDRQASENLFGRAVFSNRFTGHPYADFLYGIPTTSYRAFPPVLIDRNRWGYNFFVTDEFRVTRRLTLNLGVRYELKPTWNEESGMQALFDIGTGKIVVPDEGLRRVSPLMPLGYVDVIAASSAGYHRELLLNTDRNNVAPRIGFAWRPFGERTVIRGGYGVFFDVVPRALSAGGVPFVVSEPSYTNPTPTPTVILPRVFPDTIGGPSTVSIPAAVNRDIRTPYSMQYSFTIEHERWDTGFRISYIGTNTRQGEWSYNINQPVPDERPYWEKPRMFPKYPAISYVTNGAGHQYHSLNVEAERRFRQGLAYQISWVWARDIGDLDRGESPENAYDRRRERAVWVDIPTHRVSANAIWELPFGRGRKFASNLNRGLDLALGGWELSAIVIYSSGQFLTPQWTGPDPTGTAYTGTKTPAQVTIRPDILRNPNLPKDQRSTERWFDPTAFAAPPVGRFGTSAKGVIKGPSSSVVHAGLAKWFRIHERVRARAEITATNLFNHPNWNDPATNISSTATVARISGVGGGEGATQYDQAGPRVFRAGFRIEW